MILTCPACSTRFLVPDAAFGMGAARRARRVRCGKCRNEWLAEPPPVPAADAFAAMVAAEAGMPAPAIPTPALTPAEEIAPRPVPQGSNLPVRVRRRFLPQLKARHGVAATILFVVLGAVALLGLAPALLAPVTHLFQGRAAAPLVIENVTTRYVPQTGDTAATGATGTDAPPTAWSLVVEGTVRNVTDGELAVPPVLLLTRDANGALLGTYRPNLQQARLPAHGTTGFIATLGAADPKLSDVTVQFAGE